MKTLAFTGQFNDGVIHPDEKLDLPANTRVLVTVLPAVNADEEREMWSRLSLSALSGAYGQDEPNYPLSQLKEVNPSYAGG